MSLASKCNPMLLNSSLLLCLSVLVSLFVIPAIIRVAKVKHLFDEPSESRKIHVTQTPNLGGVGIYSSLLFATSAFINHEYLPYFHYFVAASLILVAVGMKDDLVGISPFKKFLAQIVATFIMAYLAGIRLTSFYGVLGIEEIALPLSILITILVMILIVNAYNLIDGIDGLAGGIGLVASICYAVCFYKMGQMGEFYLALALAGAVAGFLYYNITPAKTFMGDTGSLLIGFMMALFTIRFIELNKYDAVSNPTPVFHAAPAIACGILIIPLFDTMRVFTLRILRRVSPFTADRNHLHYRLLDLNFSHTQSSLILITVNLGFIGVVFSLQHIGNVQLMLFVFLLAMTTNMVSWLVANNATKEVSKPATKTEKAKKTFAEKVIQKVNLPMN